MRENRDAAGINDGLHDFHRGTICRQLGLSGCSLIADGAEQCGDDMACLVDVKEGEHVHTAARGDLDAREEVQGPVSLRFVLGEFL